MPELPEVETIVRGLNQKVRGKKIVEVWTDWPRHFAGNEGGFNGFRRQVMGAGIKSVKRVGKNIIFELGNGSKMLIHLKMTGRLLSARLFRSDTTNIRPTVFRRSDLLKLDIADPYIHTVFYFSDGSALVFSDVRKFGKIVAAEKNKFPVFLKNVGSDALSINFKEFSEGLARRKVSIKKALLDQKVLAGVGNIYADEILFTAKINPLRPAASLTGNEIKKVYLAISKILNKAIKLRGTSMSDYVDIEGRSGGYYDARLIYGREGEPCPECKNKITRIMIGTRSAHFCAACQK